MLGGWETIPFFRREMATPPLIFGPIPPYSNVPINAQFYQPSRFVISDVALGQTTLVTTTANLNYVIGQLVRLIIPQENGCSQLNEQTGYVLSIPNPNQVEISINSSQANSFISSSGQVLPQILAVGDVNSGLTSSTGVNQTSTNVPGAFINISPL